MSPVICRIRPIT